MKVRLRLTKKGKIIILAILVVILGGSGGYLLWRVNQSSNLGSENSEAGGNGSYGGCTNYDLEKQCPCGSSNGFITCRDSSGNECGDRACGDAKRCQCSDGWKEFSNTGGKSCDDLCTTTTTVPSTAECTCAISSDSCGKNCKFSSGTAKCQTLADSTGKTYIAMCNLSTGTVSCEEYNSSQKCWEKTSQCNNPLFNPTPNNPTTNTCDSGAWLTKPSGSYAHCDAISYSGDGTDSDGISTSSISVLLNGTSKTDYKVDSNSTSATISGTLGGTNACLAAGSYTLKMSWSDSKGNTSSNCSLTTTFTVQPQQTNPDWSITKNASEQCLNEDTENPSSKLTYIVTVKNTGDGTGTLSKIVDTLDTKVQSAYVSNISGEGSFADGKITWTLSGEDASFTANQSKTYTYTITVPKDNFGTYTNLVTGYPSTGDNFTATASIAADCTNAPQTGLFDSTWARVILGTLLILTGVFFSKITYAGKRVQILAKKARISINETIEERRAKKFEKRVVKR